MFETQNTNQSVEIASDAPTVPKIIVKAKARAQAQAKSKSQTKTKTTKTTKTKKTKKTKTKTKTTTTKTKKTKTKTTKTKMKIKAKKDSTSNINTKERTLIYLNGFIDEAELIKEYPGHLRASRKFIYTRSVSNRNPKSENLRKRFNPYTIYKQQNGNFFAKVSCTGKIPFFLINASDWEKYRVLPDGNPTTWCVDSSKTKNGGENFYIRGRYFIQNVFQKLALHRLVIDNSLHGNDIILKRLYPCKINLIKVTTRPDNDEEFNKRLALRDKYKKGRLAGSAPSTPKVTIKDRSKLVFDALKKVKLENLEYTPLCVEFIEGKIKDCGIDDVVLDRAKRFYCKKYMKNPFFQPTTLEVLVDETAQNFGKFYKEIWKDALNYLTKRQSDIILAMEFPSTWPWLISKNLQPECEEEDPTVNVELECLNDHLKELAKKIFDEKFESLSPEEQDSQKSFLDKNKDKGRRVQKNGAKVKARFKKKR